MVEILEETKGNLIAVRVKGKITSDDYAVFNPLMEKTLKDYEKPHAYIEVHELEMPGADALWEELKNLPDYNKFGKCAVVSDQEWLDTMAKVADKPMSPDIKFFTFDQKEKAREWLK